MATTVNAKFENAKKKLEAVLDEIIAAKILPVEVKTSSADKIITQESLLKEFDDNAREPFTIAVCGEVKAGKSTLLNSLIFEDKVLPTFETPNTAKLSFIRQSTKDTDYFVINWYTKDEWNELRSSMPRASMMEFEDRIEYSSRFDVSEFNCIGKPSVTVDDLNKLDEYTSAPDTDNSDKSIRTGIYLPFVKNIEIYIKSDKLKDLQIVDTPGLNDPNRINSNETTKWISRAHAMIYVLKSRAFGDADRKFFEVYKSTSTDASRIFVQNRIDENPTDYMNATANFSTDRELRDLGLFGPSEICCPYSSLVTLSRQLDAKGKAGAKEKRVCSRYATLNPDPEHLAEKVSQRLYKNKGYARIESLGNVCAQVYSAKKEMQAGLLRELEFKKKKRCEPLDLIAGQLKSLQKEKNCINKKITEEKDSCQEKIRSVDRTLSALLTSWNDVEFNSEIDAMMSRGGAKTVEAEFPRFWRRTLEKKVILLENGIATEVSKIQVDVRKKYRSLMDQIEAALNDDLDGLVINYAKESWNLDIDISKNLKMNIPDFWHNLFSFKNTISSEIKGAVNNSMDKLQDSIKDIPQKISTRLNQNIEATFNEICKKMNFIEEELQKIISNKNEKEAEIREIDKEIEETNKSITNCESKLESIKKLVASLA